MALVIDLPAGTILLMHDALAFLPIQPAIVIPAVVSYLTEAKAARAASADVIWPVLRPLAIR